MGRSSTSLVRSSDERMGIFLRISTFGRFQIDWFDPATGQTTPPPPERLHGQNAGSALGLFKALLSCPDRFATRAWLNEQFWPASKRKSAEERLNDVVSSLRTLLRPEGNTDMFVHVVYGTNGRGAGFRLDAYPHLWCDADAFEWYVKHAMLLDQRQQDSTTCWERAYLLAERGVYLPEQIEEDWTRPRRDYLNGLYRDCVHRWTHLLRHAGYVDEAIMQLRSYWLEHPTDEDALRPLLEMLGDRERFGEAEEYYEKARAALAEDGHGFDRHTQETIEAVRALQIQRTPGTHYTVHIGETRVVEADLSLERGLKVSPRLPSPSSLPSLAASPSPQSHALDVQRSLSSFSHYRYLPYLRNPFFTGREDVLSHLYQLLHTENEVIALTQHALCGLGGVGKTQIVLEYAYRYSDDYQAIFWAKADTQENLLTDFLMIARILHLPEQFAEERSVTTTAVKQWFQSHDRWLLILDNVDDWAFASAFLPPDHRGHILLTTRMQASGGFAYGLCVEEMNQEIGALFLLRRSGLLPPHISRVDQTSDEYLAAQKLVQEVGGLPLALDQAGAYIEETASSFQEYLDVYHTHRLELLQRRGGLTTNHPESVLTTWKVAFTQIEKHNALATHILRLCAFLDPDAIPEELLLTGIQQMTNASDAASPLELSEAISVLLRFSLVRRNGKTRTLTIHRLVQAVIQETMDQAQQQHCTTAVIHALSEIFPKEIVVANWVRCQRFLSHALLCVSWIEQTPMASIETASFLDRIGYYLNMRARYEEAKPLFQRALVIREQVRGPEHPDIAQTLSNLAFLYHHQDKYEEALSFLQRALLMRQQVLGMAHPDTATSFNALALLYRDQECYEQAESFYQQSLAIREQMLGPEHPETAHSLSNLAWLYRNQGKYQEAEALYDRSLAIRKRVLGLEHPDTATSLNGLALLYTAQQSSEKAEPLFKQALAIRQQVLGTRHLHTTQSTNALALLYRNRGEYEKAEPLFQQALAIREHILGPDHPRTVTIRNNLAILYRDQGNDEKAVPLFQHTLAVRARLLGPDHPQTVACKVNLALCQREKAPNDPLHHEQGSKEMH